MRNPALHGVISNIQMNTTDVPMTFFIFESASKTGFYLGLYKYIYFYDILSFKPKQKQYQHFDLPLRESSVQNWNNSHHLSR